MKESYKSPSPCLITCTVDCTAAGKVALSHDTPEVTPLFFFFFPLSPFPPNFFPAQQLSRLYNDILMSLN